MIRTIIVDDELLAGVGVQSLIDGQEDIQVLSVFSTPQEALGFLKETAVDIVITDIEMTDMNGLELIRIIREQNLANGIIILSCHDDFSYAQEAISKGTDSYLLKHHVSREMLVDEIKKVYEKTSKLRLPKVEKPSPKKQKLITGREIYVVGILRFSAQDPLSADSGQMVDFMMLRHLLEKIVSLYDMGTLFAPYNREMFLIFQFTQDSLPKERQQTLESNLEVIRKNIQQYISGTIISGLSTEFTDLKLVRDKYDEAASAVEMCFYAPERMSFVYREAVDAPELPGFSGERFLKENGGVEVLEQELEQYIRCAFLRQETVRNLTGKLVQAVSRMVYLVLHEYHFSEALMNRWASDTLLTSAITQAKDAKQLQEKLLEVMGQFREECLAELDIGELTEVLEYIDENLSEKLTLAELSEKSCMSIPSFSKKFKARTGKTLVQYLNEQRIERAKLLLKDKSRSLEQIAEEVGFSNANYLIRVFKKITGQTIGEYRK